MGVWLGPMAQSFFYIDGVGAKTGTYTKYAYYIDEENSENWELAVLTDCSIKFTKDILVDLFLLGSGQKGGDGISYPYDGDEAYGGSGGNGGHFYTETGENNSGFLINKNTRYPITIGINGAETSGFNIRSNRSGSTYVAGSQGAIVKASTPHTKSAMGSKGVRAFQSLNSNVPKGILLIPEFKDAYFGASGGGAGAQSNQVHVGNLDYRNGKYGGATITSEEQTGCANNGRGGDCDTEHKPQSGKDNFGQGGGGGGASSRLDELLEEEGAKGGSGILIIRNHRTLQS